MPGFFCNALLAPALLVLALTMFGAGCDRGAGESGSENPAPAVNLQSPTANPEASANPDTSPSLHSDPSTGPDPSPAARAAVTTVASLSPAATDILLGMGLADRLVAVSNYDPDRQGIHGLPRVGDYQSTDWERLASLRPGMMITQFAADRLPLGLVQKAADLKIRLVNVPITRINDIAAAMVTLDEAIGEPRAGAGAADEFRRRLAKVRERAAGPKVRALILVDDAARSVAGRENYLNDALEIAGGENAIPAGRAPYPSIDREMLVHLDPQVIFQLLPGASPQVRAGAERNWQQLGQLRAVREGRVHLFTDPWCLRPSQHAADLAEQFARALDQARPTTQAPATPAAANRPGEAAATGDPPPARGQHDKPTTSHTRSESRP